MLSTGLHVPLWLPAEVAGTSVMGHPKQKSSWQGDARKSGGQQESMPIPSLELGIESS